MPTNDQIRAMIERLEYLGDHASFEPSAHHDSAAMLRELLAERESDTETTRLTGLLIANGIDPKSEHICKCGRRRDTNNPDEVAF